MSGNTASSIRKRTLTTEKNTSLGYQNLMFAHQATAGQTSINLNSLSLPTSLATEGYTNPSASALAAADLFTNRKNLLVFSSLKGPLLQGMAIRVSTGRIDFIDFTAEQDEVFECYLLNNAQTGLRAVDATTLSRTATLPAGEVDFNVGQLFTVNLYPNSQIGAVIVDEDGFTQRRNVGNATAAPTADGNYQEIDNGTGYGTIIRFNQATSYDRNIAVVGNGMLVDKPTQSHTQEIQRLQGQIDSLTSTLAEVAGVSEEDLKAAPNDQDLAAFGDRMVDLERSNILTGNTTLARKRVQRIIADTTLGSFTITLPATPSPGDRVLIMDGGGTFGSLNLTVARNGNNILGIADDFLINTNDAWTEFVYYNSSRGWLVRA